MLRLSDTAKSMLSCYVANSRRIVLSRSVPTFLSQLPLPVSATAATAVAVIAREELQPLGIQGHKVNNQF